jgi:crotonobetainyl-CoA:carnitine CoA-transferase CaiB-like acyl-CoA transferase
LRVADRPAWEEDPRYRDRKARASNYEQLHGALSAIFKENTREYWLARLAEEDVPSGPLYDLEEVFNDPQVKEMELQVRVDHPRRGHVNLIRNGVRLSDTPLKLRHAAPVLGEHNSDVLGEG